MKINFVILSKIKISWNESRNFKGNLHHKNAVWKV